ncbi:MAG: hypothetical protein QG662_2089 [Pseudomonadota bacterium]|nr:hypothetical protein [Pseudomonadota bacterium]
MLLIRIARYVWAAPCSMVGLLAATLAFVFGGSIRGKRGVLEVSLAAGTPLAFPGLKFAFEAITLGHVIIGRTEQGLERLRLHELEHVRQYEQWGLLFFLAYPLSSLWQLMRGRNPYWDNYFEIQARERSAMKARGPDGRCG